MEDPKDEHLWRLAIKRASFKKHLYSYLILNGFLWAIWFISKNESTHAEGVTFFPWPIWSTLVWGIGIYFNYRDAYSDTTNSAESEYKKLVEEKKHKK